MIYADLECSLEKMHSCQNNPEKFYREKKLSIHLLVVITLENLEEVLIKFAI